MYRQRLIYRGFALFMAGLMLVTSGGIAADMHFCRDTLKSFSLIGEARSCHEKAEVPACHQKAPSEQISREGCCDNALLYAHFDTDYTVNAASADVPTAGILAIDLPIVPVEAVFCSRTQPEYLSYHPPDPPRDIPVLVQSFLI